MAFENLLIREKSQIGGITIDGSIQESSVREMRITDSPIEDASSVSDNVVRVPLEFTMEGIITDTPFGIDAITGVVDSVSGISGSSESTGSTRSKQVYSLLVKKMEEKRIMEVQSSLQIYRNLIFKSLSEARDKDSSRSVRFTATFKEVLIVVSSATEVDSRNIDDSKDKAGMGEIISKGSVPVNVIVGSALIGIAVALKK